MGIVPRDSSERTTPYLLPQPPAHRSAPRRARESAHSLCRWAAWHYYEKSRQGQELAEISDTGPDRSKQPKGEPPRRQGVRDGLDGSVRRDEAVDVEGDEQAELEVSHSSLAFC